MSRNLTRLLDLLRTPNGKAINALCIYMYFYNTYVLLAAIGRVFSSIPSKQEKNQDKSKMRLSILRLMLYSGYIVCMREREHKI